MPSSSDDPKVGEQVEESVTIEKVDDDGTIWVGGRAYAPERDLKVPPAEGSEVKSDADGNLKVGRTPLVALDPTQPVDDQRVIEPEIDERSPSVQSDDDDAGPEIPADPRFPPGTRKGE